MKRYSLIPFFVFFILLMGCVGITPSSAVENLAASIQNEDYDKAAENLAVSPDASPEQTEKNKQLFIASLKDKAAKQFAKNGGIDSYKIIDEAVTPDESKAYVRIRYILNNGVSVDEIVPLEKNGGRWKYVFP